MILTQFSPHSASQALYKEVISWALIISPFALVLATATLIQTHVARIRRRTETLAVQLVCVCGTHHDGDNRYSIWSPKYSF